MKDVIQAHGIPHTEVDVILISGEEVLFNRPLSDGENIEIFPAGSPVHSSIHLTPQFPKERRFICDVHLGSLARFLRMAGFDTDYQNDFDDDEIVEIAQKENRIILTRDRGILMRNAVKYGYLLRSTDPHTQQEEIFRRFALSSRTAPFTRCMKCNGELISVKKATIVHRLQPDTIQGFDQFTLCNSCNQIYWRGSHFQKMLKRIEILQRL